MKKKKIMVVDGSYLIHRNLHAMPQEADEMMIFTVLNTLAMAAQQYKPDAYLIAFDRGGSRIRTAIMPEYKSMRQLKADATPAERAEKEAFTQRYVAIMDRILATFPLHGIGTLLIPGIEGDDIAYVLANHSEYDVVLVTEDRDWIQSVNAKTVLYRPKSREEYNLQRVQAEYGSTDRYRLNKALLGKDSEFPGFYKFGPVGAKKAVEVLWDAATESVVLDSERLMAANPKQFAPVVNQWERFLRNWQVAGFDGVYEPVNWLMIEHGLQQMAATLKKPGQMQWMAFCKSLNSATLMSKYPTLIGHLDLDVMRGVARLERRDS